MTWAWVGRAGIAILSSAASSSGGGGVQSQVSGGGGGAGTTQPGFSQQGGNPFQAQGNQGPAPADSALGNLLVSTQQRVPPAQPVSNAPTQGEQGLQRIESTVRPQSEQAPPKRQQATTDSLIVDNSQRPPLRPEDVKVDAGKREDPLAGTASAQQARANMNKPGLGGQAMEAMGNPAVAAALQGLLSRPQRQAPPGVTPGNTQSNFRPADANPFEIAAALAQARRQGR